MIIPTETKISLITDTGQFERLATSVLRISNEIYAGIIHTGINTSGQTISDPVDGISFCTDKSGKKYVLAIEHTITARKDLTGKWLNKTDADLPKAIKKLHPYINDGGEYTPRVILTCKVIPSSDLVESAEQLAASHSVELDIWSNDRLADKLDISADGQAIRYKFFGTPQTRLSIDLAREISQKQVHQNSPSVSANQLVKRDISNALPSISTLASRTVFLTGESGSGKTALCHQMAVETLEAGGLAYVVSHETLVQCDTLEQALRESLLHQSPSLIVNQSIKEILQLSAGKRVVIWIEDVNASASPAALISKINKFTTELASAEKEYLQFDLKIYCPVWPENLKSLPDQVRLSVRMQSVEVQRFTQLEGREAVKRNESISKLSISDFEADQICKRLDYDPLLIGLWVGQSGDSEDEIISYFVSNCLDRCSQASSRSVSSLMRSSLEIALWLLQNRSLMPTFNELHERFRDTDVYSDLEYLCAETDLFREVSHGGANHVLGCRHDRVRDHLLINALSESISRCDYSMDCLKDPFYSELVAKAALNASAGDKYWNDIQRTMPIIIFCALKHAWKEDRTELTSLLERCDRIVNADAINEMPESVQRAIEWQIAELEGEMFATLIAWTRDDTHAGRKARILNGDVRAAAMLCYSHPPNLPSPYRDSLVTHAREKHGEIWKTKLRSLITEDHQTEKEREAALYLAGECADTDIAEALLECWETMKSRGEALSPGILYAVAACGPNADDELVQDVFNVWRTLPEADDDAWVNPRYDVANDCLSGGLRRINSDRTLTPLLQLAEVDEGMKHTIYGCLEQVDHPLAATYIATYFSDIDESIKDKKGFFNHRALSRLNSYGGDYDRNVRYTKPAMDALKLVWSDVNQSQFTRKRHFQLWSGSIDANHLLEIANNPPEKLEDEALYTRCSLKDKSSISSLRAKILDDPSDSNWLQHISGFDSHQFEDIIISKLEERKIAFSKGNKPNRGSDIVIPDILAERRDDFSERLILEHWHHLKNCWRYPHLLLCLATPKTLELYAQFYKTVKDKPKHFNLLAHGFGIRHTYRSGIVAIEQLIGLEPYLDEFNDFLIETLWDECNEKGFESWSKDNLAPLITPQSRIYKELHEDAEYAEIDKNLSQARSTELEAYRWTDLKFRPLQNAGNFIERTCKFVDSRATTEAADFLAHVISIKGTRTDLLYLEKYKNSGLLTSLQVEDVQFSVRQRTLI